MLGSELVKAASLAEEDLTFRKEDCVMFAKRRSVLAYACRLSQHVGD